MRVIDTFGGLWELLRIAVRSKFAVRKNKYWQWRYETAFGKDPDKYTTKRERRRAMLDYGRWVFRMKNRL